MKILVTLVLCITVVGTFSPPLIPIAAQNTTSPIYFLKDHDIWQWSPSGGMQRLTQDAHILDATLAPDGTRLAVLMHSPITTQALARVGGFGGGPLPCDIAIVDLATGTISTVAAQTPDAVFSTGDGRADSATLRAAPVWSPDGTHLAWTEIHYPDSDDSELRRLMIYDIATQTTQTAATDLPMSGAAGYGPMSLKWSGLWLVLENVTLSSDPSIGPTLHMYDTQTGQFQAVASTTVSTNDWFANYLSIQTGDRTLVGVVFTSGRWSFFDPATGTEMSGVGQPELYSLSAPNSALTLTFTIDAIRWNEFDNRTWVVNTIGALDYHGNQDIAIAPNGQSLAYVDANGTLTVWENDIKRANLATTGQVDAIFWGPTGWRSRTSTLAPAPVTTSPANTTCGNALSPRLQTNGRAQVIPNTTSNNLRAAAGVASTVVDLLLPGIPFSVLGGPVCADGMYWWQVDNGVIAGWTAEGNSAEYWVEPVN